MGNTLRVVAVDTGNRRTKVAYQAIESGVSVIKTDVFESRVFKSGAGFSMGGTSQDPAYTFRFNNEPFTVFPSGHGGAGLPVNLVKEGKSSGKAIKALFLTALMRNGFNANHEVSFTTNLPVGVYFDTKSGNIQPNTKVISEKLRLLKLDGNEVKNPALLPKFKSGSVFAEGCAGYADLTINDDGSERERPRVIQIFDIGGGTIDSCVVTANYEVSHVQTEEIGTLYLLTLLCQTLFEEVTELSESYPAADKIDIHEVEAWYHQGYVTTFSMDSMSEERIDIQDIIQRCVHDYCIEVANRIDIKDSIQMILLIGGGALDKNIIEGLKQRWSGFKTFVPKSPEFANVRGLLKLELYRSERDYSDVIKKSDDIEV